MSQPRIVNLSASTVNQNGDIYSKWARVTNDPTIKLLDSKLSKIYRGKILGLPSKLRLEEEISKNLIVSDTKDETINEELVNKDKFNTLVNIRYDLGHPLYKDIRTKINPFSSINRSVFINSDGSKLANIDAIFNLTKADGGYFFPYGVNDLIYCDLCGGPGAFTQYIQYRLAESFGYGITLTKENGGIPWSMNWLDLERFKPIYGKDGSGNIITNANWMADWILQGAPMSASISVERLRKYGRGVDLVMADGCTNNDELDNYPILIAQTLVALKVLWPSGDFIIRLFDITKRATSDLITIITQLFTETYMFKPISSPPDSSEFYLICKDYQRGPLSDETISLLDLAINKHLEGKHIIQLLNKPSTKLNTKINEIQDIFIERQLLIGKIGKEALRLKRENRIDEMDKYISSVTPNYPLYYVTAYWNIISDDPLKKQRQYETKRSGCSQKTES